MFADGLVEDGIEMVEEEDGVEFGGFEPVAAEELYGFGVGCWTAVEVLRCGRKASEFDNEYGK